MSISLANYRELTADAVRHFWQSRVKATEKQASRGTADQGERTGVTAGKNMDGFVKMARQIVCQNGLGDADIHLGRRVLTLPGYFRPTKLWDMLVTHEGRLIAAVEFKSQVGPSFGNNFNNRTEEAIGNAVDLWTAFREGAFGDSSRPFLGWLMLLEDCDKSQSPVADTSPHFPVFPEFSGASYARRYDILCRKLVQESLYTAASLVLSPRSAAHPGAYSEFSEGTGLGPFVAQLAAHVAAEAARSRS
jgi:hypothetical protein